MTTRQKVWTGILIGWTGCLIIFLALGVFGPPVEGIG